MAVTAAPSMRVSQLFVSVASERPNRLFRFYRDVVQLTPQPEMGQAFALGPAGHLHIVEHSAVSGAAKEPARAILDLHVGNIDAEHARLEAAGVTFSRSKGVEFWGGIISTFADPGRVDDFSGDGASALGKQSRGSAQED